MPTRATEGAVRQAIMLATGIDNLRGNNPVNDNAQLFRDVVPNQTFVHFEPATSSAPAWWFGRNDTDGVLVVDGTSTLQQLTGIVAAYIGNPIASRTNPINDFFRLAGIGICDRLVALGQRFPLGMTLAGHSLGGPVVHWALDIAVYQRQWGTSSYTHTFGAPRPGSTAFAATIGASGGIIRWMNDDDPVPLVPPRVEDCPAIIPLYGIWGCIRAANFVHVPGGLVINSSGGVTTDELPTHAQANFTADLRAWLMSWVNDEQPSHAIAEYIRRLSLPALDQPRNPAFPLAGAEAPVPAHPQAINARERANNQAFANLEAQQNAVQLVIPQQSLFHAQRVGHTWLIQFQGNTVAVGGSRRQAQSMARLGNAFLRRQQRMAVVDTAAIIQAFQQYIGQASDPAGGFSPVMSDEFPTD